MIAEIRDCSDEHAPRLQHSIQLASGTKRIEEVFENLATDCPIESRGLQRHSPVRSIHLCRFETFPTGISDGHAGNISTHIVSDGCHQLALVAIAEATAIIQNRVT